MSTKSTIAMIQPAGSVVGVYCHFDGYPAGVGKTLNTFYRDPSKVKELLTLGKYGISKLQPKLGEKQDFDHPKEDWTLFYGRDRGEKDPMTFKYSSAMEFSRKYDNEFGYLYDPESNIWFAFNGEALTYIPGQTKALVNAMWKKINSSTSNESKQLKLSEVAKKILKENSPKKN